MDSHSAFMRRHCRRAARFYSIAALDQCRIKGEFWQERAYKWIRRALNELAEARSYG